MRMSTTRALIVGLAVAAAGLASACSAEQSASGGEATSTPPASSTSASAGEPEPSSAPDSTPATEGAETGEEDGAGSDAPVDEGKGTNCGKVDGTNGQVDVVAVDTAAGTVGCVEAINVITEYYAQAPTKGQGTAYTLTVDGWSCLTDTGAQGSGAVGCDKDGLAFHTQA